MSPLIYETMGWFKKKRKVTIGYEFGQGSAWSDRAVRRATTQFLLNIATSMRLGASLSEALADHADAPARPVNDALYHEQPGDLQHGIDGQSLPIPGKLPKAPKSGRGGEMFTLFAAFFGAAIAYILFQVSGMLMGGSFQLTSIGVLDFKVLVILGSFILFGIGFYSLVGSFRVSGFTFSPLKINDSLTNALAARVYSMHRKGFSLDECLNKKVLILQASHAHAAQLIQEGRTDEAWRYLRASADPETPPAQWFALGYTLGLLFFVGTVSSFIMIKIVPKFVEIFTQLGAELPQITQTWVDYSDLAVHRAPIFLIFIVIFFGGLFRRIPWYLGLLLAAPILVPYSFILIPVLVGLADNDFKISDELAGAIVTIIGLSIVYLFSLLPGKRRRFSKAFDIYTYFSWLQGPLGASRSRERVTFLSALAELDIQALPPKELAAVAFAGAETRSTRTRAGKFIKKLEEGEPMHKLLANSALHPLTARDGRRLASGMRGGRINMTATRLLKEEIASAAFTQKWQCHLIGFVALGLVSALVVFVGAAMYAPLFALPSMIGTGY